MKDLENNGSCSSKQANNFSYIPAAWGTQTAYDSPWSYGDSYGAEDERHILSF